MALIIGDGSKRARKQIQTFDPFKEEAELRKRELEEERLRKQAEKEEKERLKLEKFLKKQAEKEEREKKRREAAELKGVLHLDSKTFHIITS